MNMKKKILISVSVVLLVVVLACAATFAYLVHNTNGIVNTFVNGEISTVIEEDITSGVKKDVKVKNTGNIAAYIRVLVAVTWVDDNGNVYKDAPAEGNDFNFSTPEQSGWIRVEGTNYFYCKSAVEPNEATPILFKTVTGVTGRAPEGYKLSVEILSNAVQTTPTSAVTDVWSDVEVNSSGLLQLKEAE